MLSKLKQLINRVKTSSRNATEFCTISPTIFYKDGKIVDSGTGMNVGGKIRSGGTKVIGQEQDKVGRGFKAEQAFVGDVTEVNVWGTVLSKSDREAQHSNCHITQGSVNWWAQR